MRDVLRALVALMFVATASAYEYSGAVEAMSNGLPHVEVLTAANFSDPPGPRAEAWFVMFYAPWCGHCHRMMPLWEEVASGFGGVDGIDVESSVSVRVAKVDATKNMGVARRYYVEFYPTLVLITNGGQVYKVGREIQRTATALAAYARGGYLESAPSGPSSHGGSGSRCTGLSIQSTTLPNWPWCTTVQRYVR